MKKNLNQSVDLTEIVARLNRVRPDSPRQWGKMTPHQMLCHLSDSFLMVMGERATASRENWFARTIMKWFALKVPLQWPHGIKTGAEADQEIGGTPPVEFNQDRATCEALIQRFVAGKSLTRHPLFGAMSYDEWMRWGYLHCDHHLRQFGV